jgi:hypothetical protein
MTEIMSRVDAEIELEQIRKSAEVALKYCPECCHMKELIKMDFMAAKSCNGDVCRMYLPTAPKIRRILIM